MVMTCTAMSKWPILMVHYIEPRSDWYISFGMASHYTSEQQLVITNFDHEQMILLVIKWLFMDHEQCSLHTTARQCSWSRLCYCQNSTGVVFSREEVREYHPIWTTPRGIARLRVGCEFHSWWYFKLNIPPKNCHDKARATPPKFHSCYDCKKRTRAYMQSSPD
jgi:hypothetical protein